MNNFSISNTISNMSREDILKEFLAIYAEKVKNEHLIQEQEKTIRELLMRVLRLELGATEPALPSRTWKMVVCND